MAAENRNIIIVGGGIIGTTTAYFLTRHPQYIRSCHKITIIEAVSLASGASGKARGLLATWASPASIAKLSFRLHAELAAKHNGAERWGYRTLRCGSLEAKGKLIGQTVKASSDRIVFDQDEPKLSKLEKSERQDFKSDAPDDLDWICHDAFTSYSEMALPGDTAQVHPFFFTKTMADLATEEGVEILFGRVTAISFTSSRVHEIIYEEKKSGASHKVTATDLILAAGSWTSQILPTVPVEAQRAHSVVIQADVSPHAIFSEILLPTGFEGQGVTSIVTPEIYPRPDGTVYACGEADSDVPLPISSDLVVCDENKCQDIINHVSSISTKLKDAEVLMKQACYLPHLKRGGPLIGETKSRGLYVATGHSCWGIQNSCATGKLISEIIFDGKATSANIDSLHPSRYSI